MRTRFLSALALSLAAGMLALSLTPQPLKAAAVNGQIINLSGALAAGRPTPSIQPAPTSTPLPPKDPGVMDGLQSAGRPHSPQVFHIGIQAGHGTAGDPGSPSCDRQHYEQEVTWDVANQAAQILRAQGHTVDVFRGQDGNMRGYVSNIFVALHNDWCAAGASGFKVSRYGGRPVYGTNGSGDASDRLVDAVWNTFGGATGIGQDRGAGHFTNGMLYYYALGWISQQTPGAIIEMGFWSGEGDILLNHRDALARGVAQSILAYLGVSPDTDDGRTIASGQTLRGRIDPANDEDSSYFEGVAGQRATIRMSKQSSGLDSYLYLYDPDGRQIAYDDDSGGNYDSLISAVALPATGRYRISSQSWGGRSVGDYALLLQLDGGAGGQCAQNQYRAEYFNNRDLAGAPAETRCEGWPIDHNWGDGGPGGAIGVNDFSVRWTTRMAFAQGDYTFVAGGDDGIRVFVDGQLVINEWRDQGYTEFRQQRTLASGEHEIKIEFYEHGGAARAFFRWDMVQSSCPAISQWKGEYFNNRDLAGPVSLCRNDPAINFDWGADSPATGISADNFSARWTRTIGFSAGRYRFHLAGDDGVRLYVDGQRVIDGWQDQSRTEYLSEQTLAAGNHEIKVEYYENGGAANVSLIWEAVQNGGSGNLILNRSASATSQENAAYAPANANDGNVNTRWSSRVGQDVGMEWWWVDLGGQSFDTVIIRWEAAYAQKYYIAWSEDCVNYYGFYYESGGEGVYSYSMNGERFGRCLAVVMVERAPSMQNYSMWEVEAYRRGALTEAAPGQESDPLINVVRSDSNAPIELRLKNPASDENVSPPNSR